MKKSSKKVDKLKWKIIPIISVTSILICILLVISIIGKVILKENTFKIENRQKNIENYQQKNKEINVNGWIRVQGTNIDYPVVYDPTNKFIETNVTSDFTWVLENPNQLIDRTVILGHNLKNVSSNPLITNKDHTRFEQLMSFIYYDFAKNNQYIQYTKDNKNYLFKIFSVTLISDYNLPNSGYLSKQELKEYINKSIEDSFFDYNVSVDENDKIISLVTCTRFVPGTMSYRFKIEGKLLAENEKTKLSEVKIKDNYKEIEDVLKGGENNEEDI